MERPAGTKTRGHDCGKLVMKPCLIPALFALLLAAGCSNTEEIARLANDATQAESHGDHQTAIARWSSVLRLAPRNAEAYAHRAALYEVKGEWTNAIADYTAYLRLPTNSLTARQKLLALAGRPEPPEDTTWERGAAFCRRGLLYGRLGDLALANADFDQAIRLNPKDQTILLTRGQLYELRGDAESALTNYNKAVQLAPKLAAGYAYRGAFYGRRGRIVEALTDLDEALRLEPGDTKALLQRGLARARHGERDKALEDLNEAAKTDPREPDLYAVRGFILLDKGEFQAAFDDFNQVLLLRPNDPVALARRGVAWARKGNIELALADLNEAIRLNPAEATFFAWRGSAYNATNQLDKALEDLNHAIQINPHDASYFAMRGSVLSKTQVYSNALADFSQALRLNPGSPEALNGLAWFLATCPDDSFRNGKEALTLATRACELTSFNAPSLLDTLAAAYAETGDFDQAVARETQTLGSVGVSPKRRPEMEERLSLFQQHKPFRQKPPQPGL